MKDDRCAGSTHYGCECTDSPKDTGGQLHIFIDRVEAAHFRTDCDTGANEYALLIWNMVREFAGLSRLTKADLPSFCGCCGKYHTGAAKKLIAEPDKV